MSDAPDSKEAGSAIVQAAREGTLEAHLKGTKREATEEQWDALVGEVLEHHLAGRIDLTTAFVGEAGTRLNHASQLLLGKVLPRVSDKLKDVVRLVESVSARGGGELPYYLINPFGRWIEDQASRPMETLGAIQSASAPQGLLRVVLSTGLKVDRARFLTATTELAAGTDAAEREAACDVLGRFAEFDAEEQTEAVTALEGALRSSTGKNVIAPLRALLLISLRGAGYAPIGLRALEEVAPRSDARVREAIAGEIMFKTQDASDELAAAAFALLKDTTKSEGATLDFIDQIASQNLNGRLSMAAEGLLDGLLTSGAADMRSLGSTRNALIGEKGVQLQATVTRWLTSGSLAHVVAVRELCMGVDGDPLTFELDFSGSALTAPTAVRIGRWTCVALTIFPEAVASVLVSLMRTGPAEAMPALGELLFDPILISYWTGPRAYLEGMLPTLPPALASTVRDAISRLDRYRAGVDAAQDIPELRPSQHHRFLVQLKRRDEQQAIDRNAREGSVLSSLFPVSLMLFGDSAIYEMEVEPGNTVRQETQLASIEYSHELPRLEVIDPFGTWYQREQLLREEDEA